LVLKIAYNFLIGAIKLRLLYEEKMGTTKQVYPLIENEKEETKENKENQNSLDSPL
jgi:hypothetical protein